MRTIILPIFFSILLVASATSWAAEDNPLWQSDWDRNLPAMELKGVSMEGSLIAPLWKEMCSRYFLRCNLYVREEEPPSDFAFTAETCQASDLLDALTAHFGYSWDQDDATGVIWIYPSEKKLEDIFGERVEITGQPIAMPMHSGVVEPVRAAFPWGTLFTQAWSDLWLATFDYPVCIPAGRYTIREVLNYCCLWSQTQAFLAMPGIGGVYLTDVNLPFDEYKAPSPGARLFWTMEIGPLATDARPSDDELGLALSSAEPRKRWAAQNYLGMCSITENTFNRMMRRLPALPLNEQTAWEIISFTAAQNGRPDIFPTDIVVGPLKGLCAPEMLETLSPDAALLVVLSTAVYAGDEEVLGRITRLDEVNISHVLLDLVRLSNFSPNISALLFDDKSPKYIGDQIKGLPKLPHVEFQKLQVKAADSPNTKE